MFNLVKIKRFDFSLFILTLFLIIIGLVLQYSLSLAGGSGSNNFVKQLIFFIIGLVLFFAVSFVDYRFIKSAVFLVYVLTILFLIFTLFFGHVFRGVKGWLSFGGLNFQPAELAKFTAIIILAKFWQESRKPIRVKHIIASFVLIIPLIFLIFFQPDLGSAAMIVFLWGGILLLIDENKKHILGLLIIVILISLIGWFAFLKDYQKERISTYFSPSSDPLERGYQITQSIIAVGSGEILGRGFGLGPQSQLKFLPASETDFVFAVLAEEFGLVGGLFFLIIYSLFLYRLIVVGRTVYDNFSLIAILGSAIYFFVQLIINVGMNIGLVPIVGVPLPFLSYGGSSLLVSLLTLGVIESIIIHQPFTKYENMITF